ncbi:MAG: hypothetical protein HY907_09920 [Deltaproteobacteria bacterium]|nr:hypothetical protein [Deltaproteobacteria bacterium]
MNPPHRRLVNAGMLRVASCFLALVAFILPRAASAQPCGGYNPATLPAETVDRLSAELQDADADAADEEAPPGQRIAAYRRIVGLAEEVRDSYSICDVPSSDDEESFRAATGQGLAGWSDWKDAAWRDCAAVVARTHASGDEARACVEQGAKPLRLLASEAPAEWLEADADGGARLFDELRDGFDEADDTARTNLAAICLAAGDWAGVLELAEPLTGSYEGDLLRAAAMAGQGEGNRAAGLYRRLVRRDPGRPEAHFNLALLAASRWWWPRRGPAELRAPFFHALAYLCLTDAAENPELADDATGFARNLEEALNGRSFWIWHGDDEQPPLPLPVSELGPEMKDYPADTPFARTCEEVLREAAPGWSRAEKRIR